MKAAAAHVARSPRALRWAATARERESLLRAAAGDDAAARNYDELAARLEDPQTVARYRQCAIDSRASAARNRAEAGSK